MIEHLTPSSSSLSHIAVWWAQQGYLICLAARQPCGDSLTQKQRIPPWYLNRFIPSQYADRLWQIQKLPSPRPLRIFKGHFHLSIDTHLPPRSLKTFGVRFRKSRHPNEKETPRKICVESSLCWEVLRSMQRSSKCYAMALRICRSYGSVTQYPL